MCRFASLRRRCQQDALEATAGALNSPQALIVRQLQEILEIAFGACCSLLLVRRMSPEDEREQPDGGITLRRCLGSCLPGPDSLLTGRTEVQEMAQTQLQ